MQTEDKRLLIKEQQEVVPTQAPSVVPLRAPAVARPTGPVEAPPQTERKASLTPIRSVDSILRCRYELKYLLSEPRARALIGYIRNYLPLDRYSRLHSGGFYPITSLYLDSHNLQLCRETLEGHKNRFKLRIRTYDVQDPAAPCFFEIKRRLNNIIIKDRARANREDVETLVSGLSIPAGYGPEEMQVLRQFRLYVRSLNAGPVVNVRYMRMAYEGNDKVRVTFDRQLSFRTTDRVGGLFENRGYQSLPGGEWIVEIKFTDCYPMWLNEMVRNLELHQQSVSKYANSVQRGYSMKYCGPRIPIRMY